MIGRLFFGFILLLSFSCTKKELPVIDIIREGGIRWDSKVPCAIIYNDNGVVDELTGSIEYRGGTSSKFDKRSYSLELGDKYSLAGISKDDDWILNASYIDKTFMRHKVSYDLFKEMRETNIASECAFVNVNVNGNYSGLYVLMEEINASMAGLEKYDKNAMLFKDPPIFIEGKLEYIEDPKNYYQQKYPKIYVDNKTDYIEDFKSFLFNSSDDDFVANVPSWVDINNVIDWHIMLLYSNNSDGIVKNFYLYKLDRGTPFRFAIWDYDHSFGRDGDNEKNIMERVINCDRSVLLKRLISIKKSGYSLRLKQRWFELRKSNLISEDWFEDQIEKNDAIIRAEIKKNRTVWPDESKWYYDSNKYEEELDVMRKYVSVRIKALDEYFEGLN